MKKILLMAVLLMACVTGVWSQSEWKVDLKALGNAETVKGVAENGDVVMLVEVEGMPADKLYRFCREWFATKYASYKDAVQLEDKENGKLIVDCKYPLVFNGMFKNDPITMHGVESFKLTCDFKDGRFRVKATEYSYAYNIAMNKFSDVPMKGSPLINDYAQSKDASGKALEFENEYRIMLSGITNSMKEYIVNADKDNDF